MSDNTTQIRDNTTQILEATGDIMETAVKKIEALEKQLAAAQAEVLRLTQLANDGIYWHGEHDRLKAKLATAEAGKVDLGKLADELDEFIHRLDPSERGIYDFVRNWKETK